MRRIAWALLLLFVFAIPWEYSLDLGEPLGNIARIAGLLLLVAAVPAVLQTGRMRTPGTLQWLVLAYFLWFTFSYFWTIDPVSTMGRIRAYFQETMVVWLVWEFAENADDLRAILCAWVAGSWVLAVLTLANFASPEAIAGAQIRFAAEGQDPNDVARFLVLALPISALLWGSSPGRVWKLLALGYLPIGLMASLLTASREGLLASLVALAGCAILFYRRNSRVVVTGALGLPAVAAAIWWIIPSQTLERLASIPEELAIGGLNQRINIWSAGWQAFVKAPLLGTGAGSFVSAAGVNPADTAHNTALSIVVGGGLCALFLATCIVAQSALATAKMHGALRIGLATTLMVWLVGTLAATEEENRTTWLLLAVIALAARVAEEARNSFDGLSGRGDSGQPRLREGVL